MQRGPRGVTVPKPGPCCHHSTSRKTQVCSREDSCFVSSCLSKGSQG